MFRKYHVKLILLTRSIDVLLTSMKSGSSKRDALEHLQQLDEQLRVIETSAKQVEGGLRDSNKASRAVTAVNIVVYAFSSNL